LRLSSDRLTASEWRISGIMVHFHGLAWQHSKLSLFLFSLEHLICLIDVLISSFLFYLNPALRLFALLLFTNTIPYIPSLLPLFYHPFTTTHAQLSTFPSHSILIISIHLPFFSSPRGSGLIAGETSRAYDETFTLS
jgi:hypothetical protein